LRLQCYGSLWISFGLAILTIPCYFAFFKDFEFKKLASLSFFLPLLAFQVFVGTFAGGMLWYGYFLVTRSRFSFADHRELMNRESTPLCGDRATILMRSFLGTDAALILDPQNGLVHFINCHVMKGFIPRVKPIYTCRIDSVKIGEKIVSTKQGKITQKILASPEGTNSLGIHEPGVVAFLGLLQSSATNLV